MNQPDSKNQPGSPAISETSGSNFIVTEDQLLPGDILIYRPKKPGIVARQISKATHSPYSHAGIFLGNSLVADSNPPLGVQKRKLSDFTGEATCVAVLRSQLGFGEDRVDRLNAFVSDVIKNGNFYDLQSVLNFAHASQAYFGNQLAFIEKNYGKFCTAEDFAKQSFFCSAFVVACYAAVGIIGESAQAAYQPSFFSPGHLYQDPGLGWFLGHLVPQGGAVPQDDPAIAATMHWADALEARWWR